MSFETNRTLQGALQLINALANHVDTRVYRPEILHCCRSAMESAVRGEKEFLAAALHARERNRHTRSSIARRAVGSTLLLKGLEADVAIILEPEVMSAQHLYVALTRGAKAVVVCSSTPSNSTLGPHHLKHRRVLDVGVAMLAERTSVHAYLSYATSARSDIRTIRLS